MTTAGPLPDPDPRDMRSDGTTLWTTPSHPAYPRLDGDRRVDVAVVGGGIVGLTAARRLQLAGQRAVLIEARGIGRQVTGGSTAKITSQHVLAYTQLADTFGDEVARAYGVANEWAIAEIARTVEALHIDCGFERRPAYTYTVDTQRLDELRAEAEVAARLGLPARFTTDIPLPLPAIGAVVFDNQAQFDPYPYLRVIARDFVAAGGSIFEQTRVQDIKEDAGVRVITEYGTVAARDVIVATNLPIIDRGGFYLRAFPMAHLVLAARMPSGESPPDGMFIGIEEPTHSMRWTRRADGLWLVLCGPRFRPGSIDTVEGFRELELFGRAHFPIEPAEYRWWNEDYYAPERLPFIGRIDGHTEHIYVATGFSGWGLTNGTVAAHILADAITETPNAWAAVFDSTRGVLSRGSRDSLVKENAEVITSYATGWFKPGEHLDLAQVPAGEGHVVEVGGEQVALSRDLEGTLHAVTPLCTHLGCVVSWNRAMQTWDCGCHGSCFASNGRVLRGPAMTDLAPLPDVLATAQDEGRRHPAT